jgi:Tfp pilus assembly protein PilF
MREMLGELLLEANDAAAALKEFEASLRDYPNRYRSFAGAARAAERSLRPTEAKTYYQKLVALAADGDGSRPDLVDARRYLAQH